MQTREIYPSDMLFFELISVLKAISLVIRMLISLVSPKDIYARRGNFGIAEKAGIKTPAFYFCSASINHDYNQRIRDYNQTICHSSSSTQLISRHDLQQLLDF